MPTKPAVGVYDMDNPLTLTMPLLGACPIPMLVTMPLLAAAIELLLLLLTTVTLISLAVGKLGTSTGLTVILTLAAGELPKLLLAI